MKYFIFRNQTIEPFFGAKDVEYSGYDDISIVPTDADGYIWFYQTPVGTDNSHLAQEVATYAERLQMVRRQIPPGKPIVVFTLDTLFNVNPEGNDFALHSAVNTFNNFLTEWADDDGRIKVVDFGEFTRRYPAEQLINWKFYFISQTLLNPKLAKDFTVWWQRKQEELALFRKKCIVLDLDNTLWGGILGEDGIGGIKIGGDYPGKAFTYWQRALLELKKTGVMLTVCSKNNEADVMEAWEQNPFMVLHKEDFVAWRINWQDKATNIADLAAELNIGLDSMVFVDDNPTERELVRQALPMVEVPEYSGKPYDLMPLYKMLVERYFGIYAVTDEDRRKTEQYRANAKRRAAQTAFVDMDDYLRSLDIAIDIMHVDDFNRPRIAQMTQKTNQFNLTTRRYTETDIAAMEADGWQIFCMSARDRFGDNGITGTIFLRPAGDGKMEIDTLLLSCRVLGKGIESAFLNAVLNSLRGQGINRIDAEYIATAKNGQVADFFDRAEFKRVSEDDQRRTYELYLGDARPIKDYYSITLK